MNETRHIRADWIAVDWGTSHVRAWAMGPNGARAEARSDHGMGGLARDAFEPVLLSLVTPWLGSRETPVIVCGMAGARQGWAEAPYRTAPCAAAPDAAISVSGTDPRIDVHILPGVKQVRPADVMRGEETQIAGFVTQESDWDGTLILPGSHCKWVQLSAREIVSFRTTLTGELFAALSDHTVLRHSMGPGWVNSAFDEGVAEGLKNPESLSAKLFGLRAEGLIGSLTPDAARAQLSGMLIGWELAATRPYWLGTDLCLIGDAALSALYARALAAQGASARTLDATDLTLVGLTSAYQALQKVL
ncbi:MAG: 2-dehydro-3-deoxygalactonokinase [Marinovum sp.]|nr:2-dehydro-3-deoxygalactonokinase [Marinovum sp.]